jgi:NAD(P)-dependent dehydrogenase (short-subunit alcohol dehydrogenase family)
MEYSVFMDFSIEAISTAIVFGSSRGIGHSLVKALLLRSSELNVYAVSIEPSSDLKQLEKKYSRLKLIKCDPTHEDELKAFSDTLQGQKIDLIINCIGRLHGDDFQPEKSLNDINLDKLMDDFKINSIVTPLIAKHFKKQLRHKNYSLFVAISAKVGSIQDNGIGGWYGYRASKAALNMFLKNIAIEFKRGNYNTSVIAIHPGTTKTELSKPFINNTPYKLHTADETAQNILEVLTTIDFKKSLDNFSSWDKKQIPW